MKTLRTLSFSAAAIHLIGAVLSSAYADQPYLFMDGLTSTIVQDARTRKLNLRQIDRNITTTVDPGTAFELWRSPLAFRGGSAIGMRIDPESRPQDASQKSKIEINVARHDDVNLDARYSNNYVLRNGSSKYLGFAFMMDRDAYEAPLRRVHHFQVWQCCSARLPPPLALQVLPGQSRDAKSLQYAIIKRTDKDIAIERPGTAKGERLAFRDGRDELSLARGMWHRLVFHLSPSPDKMVGTSGEVDLWVNGHHVLRYTGPWGYSTKMGNDLSPTYTVKLGIYRAAHQTRQQVYFDDIRWGPTFESVDPDQ